jgi:hypothetical protein
VQPFVRPLCDRLFLLLYTIYCIGKGGSDCCYNTQYSDGSSCIPCIDGVNCSTIGTNIATQVLDIGCWRASTNTTDVRKCWLPAACNNTATIAAINSTSNATILSTTSSVSSSAAVVSVLSGSNPYCTPGYKRPCEYDYCNFLEYTVYNV